MRKSLLVTLTMLIAAPAFAAEEPSGCDKFKWNIDHARAVLTAPDRIKLNTESELAGLPSAGATMALATPADAKLPMPPERAPKEGSYAGFVRIGSLPKAGSYTISLSSGAWLDVVQDGRFLKPMAFSGATDCEGVRKTMKYDLSASPLLLQISGARQNSLSIAILPSD